MIILFAHGLVQRNQLPIPEWLFAWAAALVLIAFVLVMNILAKTFAGRKRKSLEGS